MTQAFLSHITETLAEIDAEGLTKVERLITSPQGGKIRVAGREMINLCANNYLGLADHPDLIRVARDTMDPKGFGMASVRFICGTQDMHRELEQKLATFLGKDDSILFAACFDANGGLFEPLLGPEDAIISDALNHASIIDGIRLCKAKRYRYETGAGGWCPVHHDRHRWRVQHGWVSGKPARHHPAGRSLWRAGHGR